MKTAAKALRFTRVKLTNWRNFRSAEVNLSSRAFLVGPNASGKSNFLDALRFLRDLAKPTGGLATALASRSRPASGAATSPTAAALSGLSAVRCLEARNPSYVELDVDVGTDETPNRWGYQLQFGRKGSEKFATVLQEIVRLPNGKTIRHQRLAGDDDALQFTQTKLEQVGQNKEFRELVEFFASIRYLHVVPQIVRDPQRAQKDEDPYGGDLLQRIKDMPKKTREPRLRRISAALQIAVPQFRDLQLEDDNQGRPHLLASYEHWRPNASKQSEEVFSDGTLRLIGFLWSITEKGGPLLLEEPELSLHDAISAQIPAMITRAQRLSGRQVISTTHSFAMLDSPGVGLQEVHRLVVGQSGTTIETAADNPRVAAQVREAGWTVGAAVLPLAKADKLETLAQLDVAN
ncbi:AAA family ATPase [Rhodoplanes azumiensis]|uniref:AAA family ATPase n=1 Tax=Rhodoplanes azumiensis TaxID=1897628 RepID=A0ABW5ARH1_9BRAD